MDTSACSELLCGRPTMKASLKQNVWLHYSTTLQDQIVRNSGQASKSSKLSKSHAPCNNPWHLRPAPRSSDDLSLTHVLSCCAHYCHNVHLKITYFSIFYVFLWSTKSHGKQLVLETQYDLNNLSNVAHIVVVAFIWSNKSCFCWELIT